jgi:hypothetical protein
MTDLPTAQDNHSEECTAAEQPTIAAAASAPLDAPAATPPTAASQTSSSAETEALLEIIRRGLSPDADPIARTNALDVCGRIVQAFSPPASVPHVNLARVAPVAPVPGTPSPFMLPQAFPLPAPTSPLAAVVGTLRDLPPEQLFDLAIQRLRAALPQGAAVPEAKGIQFQLVPVTPSGAKP